MTEFLKGYAAGANDMEAGRLVKMNEPTTTVSRQQLIDLRASALTAEEAQAVNVVCSLAIRVVDRTNPDRERDRKRLSLALDAAENANHKLSLITNGENG